MNLRRPVRLAFAFATLVAGILAPALTAAESVTIAAAANLVHCLDDLHAAFRAAHPAIELTATTGASGSLVAQIRRGAPFDVLLSADLEYPQALIQENLADPATLQIFAVGKLVLWTKRDDLPGDDLAAAVRATRRLALANPDTAPYGRAAKATLEKLALWDEIQPRIVTGENIAQTLQFVDTGNADAGFVALGLLQVPALRGKGHVIAVAPELHPRLDQGVVLTTRGAANPAARTYLAFLASEPARAVFDRFGFGRPE